jgi:hypothetical protein
MKKVFSFFVFVFLLSPVLFSQSFFEKDTKYVVRRYVDVENGPSYNTFQELVLDSVKQDDEFYHLLVWIGDKNTKYYFKASKGKVYIIDKTFLRNPNDYHLIYDFNLSQGDIINVDSMRYKGWGTISGIKNYKNKIDSVKTFIIQGKLKKAQFVTVESPPYESYKFLFVEGLGCLQTGLLYYEIGDLFFRDRSGTLRICINDSAYNPKIKNNDLEYISTPCMDSAYQHMVDVKNSNKSDPSIFPNPIKDRLTIKDFKGNIALYDFKGSLLLEETITYETQLDVQFLPKGIYYLKFFNNKGLDVRKIIKL